MIRPPAFIWSILFLLSSWMVPSLQAQQDTSVNWLTFEELEKALAAQPKKVFIDFYTDWCSYCRKMDKVVFTHPDVITTLNQEYYAVRFDAECKASRQANGKKITIQR